MTRSVCFCLSHQPSPKFGELVDAMSVCAAFDLPMAVVFLADSVEYFFTTAAAETESNSSTSLSQLSEYGVEQLWVEKESLEERRLLESFNRLRSEESSTFLRVASVHDRSWIRGKLEAFDMVVND